MSNTNLIGKNIHFYENSGEDEHRVFLNAKCNLLGKSVSFYNTHLTHISSEARLDEITELANVISNDTSDVIIVTGDFNMDYTVEPESFSPLTNLGMVAMNTSLPTYPRENPTKVIDNIFVKGEFTKVNEGVISAVPNEMSAIDHRAYYVDIEI